MGKVLVALGGNALQPSQGLGSWAEARATFRRVVPALLDLAEAGHELVLTHGNGPQVGRLLRQSELAGPEVPMMPLDVLGAESQGQIGYLLQEELAPALAARGIARSVLTIISRTEVDRDDPAFAHPTKPVGRFYRAAEARALQARYGWAMGEDAARGGWRRLVASPRPLRWLEGHAVRTLLEAGLGTAWIPVVSGGGGVPVVRGPDGSYQGVEAVIDKDLAAALVARELELDTLAIVTDVPAAALDFGGPAARWLGRVPAEELREHLDRGAFGEGSMRPKVEAVLDFVDHGGARAVITDIASLGAALRDAAGTRVGPGFPAVRT